MPNTTETNQNANSAAVEKGEPPRIEIRDHATRENVRAGKNLKSSDTNKVIIQTNLENLRGANRLLDLNNINTPSLKTFSPTEKEIADLKINRENALAEYSDRLRFAYKENTQNFRDGLKLLSDSLEKGERITVACACRDGGAMCHADVVKLAVEKVNAHIREERISEKTGNDKDKAQTFVQKYKQEQTLNPRTQRAINEIFSFSENDRVLEKINDSSGRNRSEQASYLGGVSQFVRDIYERGGLVMDGNLIVPQEKLSVSQGLAITTQDYAVEKLDKILQDETKAKELAPLVVEYGNKIAGLHADGETKLKVFGWIYDSLEDKGENLERDENNSALEKSKFDETLREFSVLAEEMHSLEPLDKMEFVPLAGYEQNEIKESVFDNQGENLNLDEIYEEAISLQENEKEQLIYQQNAPEQAEIIEPNGKINTTGYERIGLGADVPRIPEDLSKTEISKLITETLPEIDLKLENGITPKEILLSYNQAVWQSAREDALNRLESIYQNRKINAAEPQLSSAKAIDDNQNLRQQLAKIDLRRQNIIELKLPGDYLPAEKEAVASFYRRQKQEVGRLLTKIDEVREKQVAKSDKTEEQTLKKELMNIKDAKPNFAFKLENSTEIVVGKPSQALVETRNFISSYVNYQLKQPETRLRFENERYRIYAGRLESAASRDEVMKTASEIRTENASIGISWKDLTQNEKEKLPRPLSQKEMQFLFTESSPAHYTNEMTALRLSYAHSGASRRQVTESLVKGEITPSPEAQKLIESLESRLNRREITDSLSATKHFFESVKTPNEGLKYKNSFDHREIYEKLPPQEKDFIYTRAALQKENLEYQILFKKEQPLRGEKVSRLEIQKPEISRAEKSFHLFSGYYQARILGARIDIALAQKEIPERDVNAITVLLKNQRHEKLEAIGQELQKSENVENKKVGEVLQTFALAEISKDENKTNVSIQLPESGLVSTETYRELLEKFYPDAPRENAKFKFENFGEKEISRVLRSGQNEAINNFREDIKANVYPKDASPGVFETETSVLEKIDKIKQFQTEARTALRENQQILDKYSARVNSKMQAQKIAVPNPNQQKEILELALGKIEANLSPNKETDRFLQAAQKEITISDFQKFAANEKLLGETKFNIRQEFAELSQDLNVLDESKVKTGKAHEAIGKERNLFPANSAATEIIENKPLSLRVFEKELEKAEKYLLGASLKEKLSGETAFENEKSLDPKAFFSKEERASIKMKAFELTKDNLEPKELNAVNQKLSPEASRQAFATYKQLERASNLFQTSDDKSRINKAFFNLDHEATKLNEIRQNYDRNEKIAVLQGGIKTDLIDWLRKNPDSKQNNLEDQINKILMNNLNKTDFVRIADNGKQISVLSRQIAENIEAKQTFAVKDKRISNDSRESGNQGITHFTNRENQVKANHFGSEKMKDKPTLTR